MKQIIYGDICLLQNPRFVKYDKALKKWYLDEAACHTEFKTVANAGAVGIRLLPYGVWNAHPYGIESQFQPYAMVGTKYDLSKFNDWYFPIVRRVVQIARQYGLKTWWVWLDNCQFWGIYRKWSPWAVNTQGIGSFYEVKAYPFIKSWIQKCHTELSPYYVNWCWGNETTPMSFREVAKNAIWPMITKLAIPARNMTYGAILETAPYINGEYQDINKTLQWLAADIEDAMGKPMKLGIWREVHGIGRIGYPKKPNMLDEALCFWARTGRNGIRIWLSDDGTKTGDSPCDKAVDGARPSATRWTAMVKSTLSFLNDFTYEHLPQDETAEGLPCQGVTLKSIYKAINGVYPTPKY